MRHHTRFGALVLLGFGLFAAPSRAQGVFDMGTLTNTLTISQGGAPDMSDFGGAIAQGVEDAPQTAPATKGPIASGLTVPRVKPGQGAREMFEAMRQKVREAGATNPEMLKILPAYDDIEKQAPALLTAVEAECKKRGFAPRDMGTAYAIAFLTLRESATGKTTTETQDKAVVQTVAKVIPGIMGAKWKTLTPAHKEKLYETLIMGAAINGLIVEQLAKTGDATRLAAQRQDAADAFKNLVGVPPEQVEISPEGQISGTVPLAPEDGAAPTEAPAKDAPAMDEPTDAPK